MPKRIGDGAIILAEDHAKRQGQMVSTLPTRACGSAEHDAALLT
jgi:hypothetical protein